MNEDVEASVRSLFGQAKAPDLPPKKTKKVSTIIPYGLAGLAAPIPISEIITIAAPKPEPPRYHVMYYKVPSVDRTIQPAAYTPCQTEFTGVGCVHLNTRCKPTDKDQQI